MRQSQNIKDLVDLAPDYIGFIFYKKSPRYAGSILSPETTSQIPGTIKKTGVFVNSDFESIIEICNNFNLNTVQLHGDETPHLCGNIQKAGLEVIKAFSLKSNVDIENTRLYKDYCDYFLFDTPTLQYGGSGKKFDWSILEGAKIERPFFLSGGIEEADAATILEECPQKPYALDVNSKFEVAPGLKNIESIKRFIEKIRQKQTKH